jgi:glyoxylase-like metal-dependent hydrolase (beta-lactamase superfamily II)
MRELTRRAALCGCLGGTAALSLGLEAAGEPAKRPDFVFDEIAPGVWRHTSWSTLATGAWFPSNGMVVVGPTRALMVDTAWTEDQTTLLLGLMSPIVGRRPIDLFITHFHDDRLGGIAVTASRGIASHAFERSVAEAKAHNAGAIDRALKPDAHMFDLGGRVVEAFYPGPGHTIDNAVACDRETKVVFGGCMIRAAAANDMGNTADGVLSEWGASVARTAARYPGATQVIPGHGKIGDKSLFAHTIALAARAS